jgi:hypothetical protein
MLSVDMSLARLVLYVLSGEEAGCLQGGLDAFRGRDGQQGLRHAGAEAGEDCPGTGHLAVFVGEEALVLVEGDETWAPVSLTPRMIVEKEGRTNARLG